MPMGAMIERNRWASGIRKRYGLLPFLGRLKKRGPFTDAMVEPRKIQNVYHRFVIGVEPSTREGFSRINVVTVPHIDALSIFAVQESMRQSKLHKGGNPVVANAWRSAALAISNPHTWSDREYSKEPFEVPNEHVNFSLLDELSLKQVEALRKIHNAALTRPVQIFRPFP